MLFINSTQLLRDYTVLDGLATAVLTLHHGFYFTRMDLFLRKVNILHILNTVFEYLECKFQRQRSNVWETSGYRILPEMEKNGVSRQARAISRKKRIPLSTILNGQDNEASKVSVLFFSFSWCKLVFAHCRAEVSVGRSNTPLVSHNSKTRLPRNAEVLCGVSSFFFVWFFF